MPTKQRIGLVLAWAAALLWIGWLITTWGDNDHTVLILAMVALVIIVPVMRRTGWYPEGFPFKSRRQPPS